MLSKTLTSIVLTFVLISSASADHHGSLEFLKSFVGTWDATDGLGVSGPVKFTQGASGHSLIIQSEMGGNKFDDFITYDPESKVWLMIGVGEDGSRWTHTIKSFPKGKMKQGQKWSAETKVVTADGEVSKEALQLVATSDESYEMTVFQIVDGQKKVRQKMNVKRRVKQ